ncbi:MAG: ParB/RepB/Spo0J family partition protein [Desulfomonilaceae bacterium]
MNWRKNIREFIVNPNQIELSNRTYYLPCYEDIDILVTSINQIGLMSPPVVRTAKHGKLIPVSGRRRIDAAVRAGLEQALVYVIDPETPEPEILDLIFWDNVNRIRNNLVCSAIMVTRLMQERSPEIVAEKYLPWIGIPPRGPKLEKLKLIAGLEERSLRMLWDGRIQEKSAVLLSRLNVDERSRALDFLELHGFNANKSAEMLQAIYDISVLSQCSTSDTISKVTQTIEEECPDCDMVQKAVSARNLIKKMKNANLFETQDSFIEWLEEIQLPSNMKISHTQSFESSQITLEIKAYSRKEVENMISKIKELET